MNTRGEKGIRFNERGREVERGRDDKVSVQGVHLLQKGAQIF